MLTLLGTGGSVDWERVFGIRAGRLVRVFIYKLLLTSVLSGLSGSIHDLLSGIPGRESTPLLVGAFWRRNLVLCAAIIEPLNENPLLKFHYNWGVFEVFFRKPRSKIASFLWTPLVAGIGLSVSVSFPLSSCVFTPLVSQKISSDRFPFSFGEAPRSFFLKFHS